MRSNYIRWFNELSIEDVPLVGGKNASLGEMYQKLTKKRIKVPNGFAVTAKAYQYLIESAGIDKQIRDVLKDLDTKDVDNFMERGHKVRELILNAPLPPGGKG